MGVLVWYSTEVSTVSNLTLCTRFSKEGIFVTRKHRKDMHNNKWQNKSGRGEKFVEVVRLLSADQSNYDVWHLLTSVRFIKLFFFIFTWFIQKSIVNIFFLFYNNFCSSIEFVLVRRSFLVSDFLHFAFRFDVLETSNWISNNSLYYQ